MKKCSICKIEKNNNEFYIKKDRKSGLSSQCKLCIKNKNKIKKDKISKYQKKYYNENKKDILLKVKQYKENNKTTIKETNEKYYNENKKDILLKAKHYYKENKNIISNTKKIIIKIIKKNLNNTIKKIKIL